MIMESERFTDRWVAYFDLLGFKKLLEKYQNFPEFVLDIYQDILSKLDSAENKKHNEAKLIDYCWFSDTFLLWSVDNEPQSFPTLEQSARLFFSRLILEKIPVRGSISYGSFYADKHRSIYMGQALVEAYEYAEKQQWLNYVLTPALFHDLPRIGLNPLNLLNYHPISTFPETIYLEQVDNQEHVLAYTYSANDSMGKYIKKNLGELSKHFQAEKDQVRQKYDNSLAWLAAQQKRFEKMRRPTRDIIPG